VVFEAAMTAGTYLLTITYNRNDCSGCGRLCRAEINYQHLEVLELELETGTCLPVEHIAMKCELSFDTGTGILIVNRGTVSLGPIVMAKGSYLDPNLDQSPFIRGLYTPAERISTIFDS
jgi:hypothetical protein